MICAETSIQRHSERRVEAWIKPLSQGDCETAWTLFIERYRRLIFSAIRRYSTDPDDVMDVFARVCEALRENDFARLRRCAAAADADRPLSTWLVVVVHNLTIDWLRHRDGRRRLGAFASRLSPLRRRIFELVFAERRSHVEAYETLRSEQENALSFGEFLKEVSAIARDASARPDARALLELAPGPPPPEVESEVHDPVVLAERREMLESALQSLPAEDRVAVQLYVMEGMPAEQVARALGFAGAKGVYNRVYRALKALRSLLEVAGIRAGDL